MRFAFDGWVLDTGRRVLSRGAATVELSPKAYDLLKLLVEHHDRAFSKAELHQHLWADTFVSDGSLTILVAEIRQVLEDDAERPRFVRTLRRFGYGFCAPVVTVASSPVPVPPPGAWLVWGDRTFAVAQGETVVGRALEAALRFDVPGVSRRHARIRVEGANVTVEDLGSQNGTYVRGQRIGGPAVLGDGDELRLGPVSMLVRMIAPDHSTVPM